MTTRAVTPSTVREGSSKGRARRAPGKRGGAREGAGTHGGERRREVVALPAVAQRALTAEGGRRETEISRVSAALGAVVGELDQMRRVEPNVLTKRYLAETEVRKLKEQLGVLEAERVAERLAAKKGGDASRASSNPTPPPPSRPASRASTAPTGNGTRKYNSVDSKKRAVRKLRQFLALYPAEAQAELIAKSIVVDGRGAKSLISVSLVKSLLSSPRMARHMKEHAENILTEARDHIMKQVLSAENFVSAHRLLKLSYRKLEWLRRLLSHDGSTPRVMHPKYDTHVPSNASIPSMRSHEAAILKDRGGIQQQEDGCGAVCEDLDRTLSVGIAIRARRGELASAGTPDDPHVYVWAGDGFQARKKNGKWVQLGAILASTTTLNQSPTDSRYILSYKGGSPMILLTLD